MSEIVKVPLQEDEMKAFKELKASSQVFKPRKNLVIVVRQIPNGKLVFLPPNQQYKYEYIVSDRESKDAMKFFNSVKFTNISERISKKK